MGKMVAQRKTGQRKTGKRRSGRVVAWAMLAVAALAVVLLIWPDIVPRVLHPRRYAVSGERLLPVDRYVAAARGAVGARVARVDLPGRSGPVVVTGAGRAYLDPPTARVLDVVAGVEAGGARSMADPAQPVAVVVDHARAIVTGGRLATVEWPTTRNPDWTVVFTGGGRDVAIKVADDTGAATAAPAR